MDGAGRSRVAALAVAAVVASVGACGGDGGRGEVVADAIDGDGVVADAIDGDAVDGDAVDGDAVDGDGSAGDAVVGPRPAPGPGFHRDGRWLVDELGRALILHGANVSNSAKYSVDLMPWQAAGDLAALAAAGFDSVRLLMSWQGVMPADGVIDEGYLDGLAERVGWARDAGLAVVLDMHQDVFGYGFGGNGAPRWACDEALYAAHTWVEPWFANYAAPEVAACFDRFYTDDALFGRFVEAWVAVARRLGGDPAVVGFDLMNEPYWGTHDPDTFMAEVWQPRQEALAAALRAVAPDRVAFFETPPLFGVGIAPALSPPADRGVALAPHYYHPVLHEGIELEPWMLDDLDDGLDAIAASDHGFGDAPVWLGEFGCDPRLATAAEFLAAVVSRAAARGWGWAVYSDDRGDGFGLRDAEGTLRSTMLAALAGPYARRVPGALDEVRADPLAGTFEATFAWEVDAPLVLWDGGPGAARAVSVRAVDEAGEAGVGAEVACVAGEPAGVWTCAPPAGIGWGSRWQITIAAAAGPITVR